MNRIKFPILIAVVFEIVLMAGTTSAQWQALLGPSGGIVQCFDTVKVTYGSGPPSYVIYAGTLGDGVFVDSINANYWLPVTAQPGNLDIYSIADSGGYMYIGTASGVYLQIGNGVPKSANNGLTSSTVRALMIHYGDIYAGTDSGLFISTDNGADWTKASLGSSASRVNSLTQSGSAVFAGTASTGVLRSTDNGSTWSAINNGLGSLDVNCLLVNGSDLLAGTSFGLYSSTNSGTTWNDASTGLTDLLVLSLTSNAGALYAGTFGGGVYISTDNGNTWEPHNFGLTSNSILALASVPGIEYVYAGTTGGAFVTSPPGGTPEPQPTWMWNLNDYRMTNAFITTLGFRGDTLVAGSNSGVWATYPNFNNQWQSVNLGLTTSTIWCQATNVPYSYVGTDSGVFVSTIFTGYPTLEKQWTAANVGMPPFTFGVHALAVKGDTVFAGTGAGGVFISTNDAGSWSEVDAGLTSYQVNSFALMGSDVFVGQYGGGVYLSTDNGSTWSAENNGLSDQDVNCLAVAGNDLFAGTTGGVFLSTDDGTSWTTVNNGLTSQDVYDLAVWDNNLFASFQGGSVLASTDDGGSWNMENAGMSSGSAVHLAIDTVNKLLYFSGSGDTLWSRPLSQMVTAIDAPPTNDLPHEFSLSQNYPNPFNPTTVISYQLSAGSDVTLKVYDVLGREVATLVNQKQSAGKYSVTFDGSKLASGVYFYRLVAGSYIAVKKLVLLK